MCNGMSVKNVLAMMLASVACLAASATAKADYAKLEAKADRFVQLQEWNSANAMYILMAEARPSEARAYSRAIVSSGMMKDSAAQVDMLERTQKYGIPMDSVFEGVKAFSYEAGVPKEYESFLKLVKKSQPWIARHINVRLLKYYDFRNDAANMVTVGRELLASFPDDLWCLSVVGRGYMIAGKYENAVATYKKVLEADPENYDALVALGNYYYVMWKASEGTRSQMTSVKTDALNYLKKAYAIRNSEHLSQVISELEPQVR